jgi:3-dehydroquinate dehydratase I
MSSTITDHKLAELLSSTVPAIAVSFADEVTDEELSEAQEGGLDVYELRIDRYASFSADHVLAQVRRFADRPTIATIRTDDEGGQWIGSEAERLALFKAVIPEVGGIEVELRSSIAADVVRAAHKAGKVAIVSNHNFDETLPIDKLEWMAYEAKNDLGADFVKLSAMTHSLGDIRTLAEFTLKNASLGLIVVGMGEHGTASRVFFPALGSCLTYAYAQAWPVSGQLTFRETFAELRLFYPEFNQKKIIDCRILEDA